MKRGRVVQAGWLRVSEEGRQLARDFATLEVPEVKTGVRSFSELLECLAEWFDESVVEQLQLVQQWARRGRPPPDRAQPDGRELESLGRLYRSLRYVARVHAVRMPPGWDRIGLYLRLPHPVRREVSDVVAVRRLARRMAVHLLPEESRILGLDVESWRVFDPRELAHLTGIPVGQATRLLFGYFEDLTPPRKARLQAWARLASFRNPRTDYRDNGASGAGAVAAGCGATT
jgi:hypothetical protein